MDSTTDSVSIFAEGTYEEQILELLSYVVRNRSDEDRAVFVAPFHNALKSGEGKKPIGEDEQRRRLILSKLLQEVRGLGDGSEKEAEGFFNLLFAHIFSVHHATSPEAKDYIDSLLKAICSSSAEQATVKYRILSNLFNTLPRSSALRLSVCRRLLEIASSNEGLEVLDLKKSDVEKWLSEWEISPAEKGSLLLFIMNAYKKIEQPSIAYDYLLLYVKILQPPSEEARSAAIEAVASALRLSTILDFDTLYNLEAVLRLKDHELFDLLQIFMNGSLSDYKAWELSHPGALEKYQIPSADLEHKIRLLTLASLAFQYVGQNVPYSKIAVVLQVDIAEVEKWAIDVIRAQLVWGKLSQTSQSFYIARATSRKFEQDQWQVLEKRLIAWRSGLTNVLDVIASAKKLETQAAVAPA